MQRTTVTIGLWIGLTMVMTSAGYAQGQCLAGGECPIGDSTTFSRRKTEKGKLLYWATRKLAMELNYSSVPTGITRDDFREVVRTAQSTWSNVGCTNFEFDDQLQDTPDTATNLSKEGFDGSRCEAKFGVSTSQADCINRIVFRTSKNPDDPLYWPQDPSDPMWQKNCTQDDCRGSNPQGTLALTTTVFNEATGRIIDADMDINAANYQWTMDKIDLDEFGGFTDKVQLQSVMTHELGHVLGFGHICGTVDSIMEPCYQWNVDQLNKDNDENAICTTYPWDSITPESGTVILSGIEGGCSVVARAPVGFGWLLFSMAWLMWRRRARHAC